MNNRKYCPLISFVLFLIILSGCSSEALNNRDSVEADSGAIDLRGWDFENGGIVNLDGQWEFYWDKFLLCSDLPGEKPDLYVSVPDSWNNYVIGGKRLPGDGYATYRLHVITDFPAGTMMGLRPYTFSSAYRLFVNDLLIGSAGQIAADKSGESGEYRPQQLFFEIPAPEFDIILQVSNYHYARGGFWYSMPLGTAEKIADYHDLTMGKEIFVLGALIIVSFLFFAIFLLQREFVYSLYFSCFCLFMAVTLDMVGQFIIPRIIPGISLRAVIIIWYSSVDWVLLFFILYLHELYKSRLSHYVTRIYTLITILFLFLYIFLPTSVFTSIADAGNIMQGTVGVFLVVIVGTGVRKKYKDSWLNILGLLILLVSFIHDSLYWTNRIHNKFGEIIYIGLFLFILIQMIIQAGRIKHARDQETAAELSFLQAQIKPHFLFNTLNTFVSISRYDMDKARELLLSFSNYLRRSFDFKDLSQLVPLKDEIEMARSYAEIETARFEDRLEIRFDVPDDLEVKVPILTLQPVLENAVNHGILPKPEGGRIDVTVRREGKLLKFCVKDNGVGTDADLKKGSEKTKFGSGVGLSNIDSRLRKLFRQRLHVVSSPGNGTEVVWYVPVGKNEAAKITGNAAN